MLNEAIYIRKRISEPVIDQFTITGNIDCLSTEDITNFTVLINGGKATLENSLGIEIDDSLESYIGKKVTAELKIGSISNYYESKEDFFISNKLECNHSDFYIHEMDYRMNVNESLIIEQYRSTVEIINLLKSICSYAKSLGDDLELFFYKFGNGATLQIEYKSSDLYPIDLAKLTAFKTEIFDGINNSDRKEIFLNELVSMIEKAPSFSDLLENWELLVSNYTKSYSLFVAGFSFEKIKTSSTEHFQKLIDKISESIGKASTYIFGVPVGYILLLNGFDFTGLQIGKNFILLILGSVFIVLIWHVLFKNISESIDNIEEEISDFSNKIAGVTVLNEISEKLDNLKSKDINRQRNKLRLVKILSSIIYILLVAVWLYTFFDISVFYF